MPPKLLEDRINTWVQIIGILMQGADEISRAADTVTR
jgi:hypothetical protein